MTKNTQSKTLPCTASDHNTTSHQPRPSVSSAASTPRTSPSSPSSPSRHSHSSLTVTVPSLWNNSFDMHPFQDGVYRSHEGGHCDFVLSCLESAIALSEEVAAFELDAMQIDFMD